MLTTMNSTPEPVSDKSCSNSAQRILETAEYFFARLGFMGTRVDEIARVAHINKRMIYYHYGSKEGLYQAVLEKHLKPMIEMSRHVLQTDLPPAAMLERLLNTYFDFLATHRVYVRLISWEVLGEGNQLSNLGFRRQTFEQVVHYFEVAQRQGQLRPDCDVSRTLMAGMLLCYSYFSQMQYMQSFYSEILDDPEQYEHWKRSVLAMLLRSCGLEPA
ncbi:TetR/AcrR family transcriptional regulator [Gloeobacter morelensis]|uniref:TetR/AcrR family transcriptional regulator n=1 Tax=Gloeobacter morelensis MG652769 TaxID=2781736 RepID=A0ABY3PNG1_9CYAN|nr:TetR/AcrR family transcriptional regulator [Gloeobacter morelensis]UFP95221.1 TetR/AcrR family transcriptional regulator [Gloeobacter morelensis MG652769]